MRKPLLIALAVVFFIPNLFNTDIHPWPPYNGKEKFDTSLSYINTVQKLVVYIDSVAAVQRITTGSLDYVITIESVLEKRFYHGFSHFRLNENWIAALAGKIFKEDYACKVLPEEIIKEPNAACSQQELVMMAVLREKKLPYRSVLFAHHYALEVYTDSNWCFFDANMEPNIPREQRVASYWNHNADNLKKYYDDSRFNDPNLDFTFGKNQHIKNGPVNEIPAPRARLFNSVTGVLSKIVWCFPLLLLFYRRRKTKIAGTA